MTKQKSSMGRYSRGLLWAVVAAAVVYLIARNIGVFGNVLLAVIGFGTVVLVHECGHFVVAKLAGIKVEAFSIFMPPTLLGVRKTKNGFRFRILPKFFRKAEEGSREGLLSSAVGTGGKTGETEYRIGLVPFGGFVKMLGQEDVGSGEASDDPRSYANKPVGTRMAVIAAGVFFNIVSAIIAFMMVFLIGINLIPPVVGLVLPNSPAGRAGLRPGDEIIEIAGKSDNLDFMDVQMAAALSDVNEAVAVKVRHQDGSEESFALVAEELGGRKLKGFGILPAATLTVAKVSDANELFEKTGLLPGDRIVSVNGKGVQSHWELSETIQDVLASEVTVLAKRKDELIKSQIGLELVAATREVKSEADLGHICSMVPHLRITAVTGVPDKKASGSLPAKIKNRLAKLLGKTGTAQKESNTRADLRMGDIIFAIGDVKHPTFQELRDVAAENEDKELAIEVLRVAADGTGEILGFTVVPRRPPDGDRAMIGIGVVLDAEHPVVAKTIATEGGPEKLAIPRGARITAVGGVSVSSFYDIIREIRKNAGRHIRIEYRIDGNSAGSAALDVGDVNEFITVKPTLTAFVPFEYLERLYKASGPVNAVVMGYRKTAVFIAQAYMTLKRFVGGLVSPKEFMGPVGIVTLGYKILTEKPLIYYVYVLALISAFIGVLNSVPMLPFDGGHIVFLLIEKIKGSPVNERVQGAIAYVGWVLVGALFLYVTFNDIVRSFFS